MKLTEWEVVIMVTLVGGGLVMIAVLVARLADRMRNYFKRKIYGEEKDGRKTTRGKW